MKGFPHPWYVCGGWAIDLFLGEVTREHEDLEIAIPRADQEALRRHYEGWGPFKSVGGWQSWAEGEFLELPIHQVLFRPPRSGPPRDPWEASYDERQFFLDDAQEGVWICRRDARVTRPFTELTSRSSEGIPFVVPEVQLLYKAKHHLEKDEHDFERALPRLHQPQRTWLKDALGVVHPDDPWLEALS
jgi:hypothetical protein